MLKEDLSKWGDLPCWCMRRLNLDFDSPQMGIQSHCNPNKNSTVFYNSIRKQPSKHEQKN